MEVHVYLAEGFEEMEAVTPVDILRRAGVEVKTVSVMEERLVAGAHGIKVEADLLFSESKEEECRMIVLPGGMPGMLNLQRHPGLAERIRRFAGAATEDRWLAAICAAPAVYGELGLLRGKKATCYPGMEEHLLGAEVVFDAVVRDGRFITSRGAGTAVEFALALTEALCGEKTAKSVGEGILFR